MHYASDTPNTTPDLMLVIPTAQPYVFTPIYPLTVEVCSPSDVLMFTGQVAFTNHVHAQRYARGIPDELCPLLVGASAGIYRFSDPSCPVADVNSTNKIMTGGGCNIDRDMHHFARELSWSKSGFEPGTYHFAVVVYAVSSLALPEDRLTVVLRYGGMQITALRGAA
jgi:hypothetical protein